MEFKEKKNLILLHKFDPNIYCLNQVKAKKDESVFQNLIMHKKFVIVNCQKQFFLLKIKK